jgi:hypothetical protein
LYDRGALQVNRAVVGLMLSRQIAPVFLHGAVVRHAALRGRTERRVVLIGRQILVARPVVNSTAHDSGLPRKVESMKSRRTTCPLSSPLSFGLSPFPDFVVKERRKQPVLLQVPVVQLRCMRLHEVAWACHGGHVTLAGRAILPNSGILHGDRAVI